MSHRADSKAGPRHLDLSSSGRSLSIGLKDLRIDDREAEQDATSDTRGLEVEEVEEEVVAWSSAP